MQEKYGAKESGAGGEGGEGAGSKVDKGAEAEKLRQEMRAYVGKPGWTNAGKKAIQDKIDALYK
jgi:hypothetical protein